jgi:hypothetical protein
LPRQRTKGPDVTADFVEHEDLPSAYSGVAMWMRGLPSSTNSLARWRSSRLSVSATALMSRMLMPLPPGSGTWS